MDTRREVLALRAAVLAALLACVAADLWRARGRRDAGAEPRPPLARGALALWAAVPIGFMVFLWWDHAAFPFQLEVMEETLLGHITRAAHGLPVYPEPTPDYVALAYNPLFYYLCVPFTWVFGEHLEAARIAAIAGALGSGLLIYASVRAWTGSRWWGWIGLGLFASAYRAMDTLLDNAHADSWLLCTALAGTYLIDRARTRRARLLGVVVLVVSFWFKQHGALFVLGGVAFLTWRESWQDRVAGQPRGWAAWRGWRGWRGALPYWVVAAILGPGLYLAAARWPFGPAFHYFTWDVPRGWSRVNTETFVRVARFFWVHYGVLAIAAGALTLVAIARAVRDRDALRVWHVQLAAAVCSAVMGSLDWGSSDNVFIPLGGFLIVVGTVGLAELVRPRTPALRAVQATGVALAFAALIYAPETVIVSPRAAAELADFAATMRGLPGPVYAPDIGPAVDGVPLFHPGAHWVALEDMGRGPGHTDADRARAYALLAAVVAPRGEAYIISYRPLDSLPPPVALLAPRYRLAADYGERWGALRTLPRRWVTPETYPRFLYRYAPPGALPAASAPVAQR